MAYTYDKDTDYKKLMDEAVARGDHYGAAQYEQQRNAKIKGEGITDYQTTNDYAGNLDQVDYSERLRQMMGSGADSGAVKGVLDTRVNKANSAVNLNQYAYDDVYAQAMDYIKNKKMEEFTYAEAPEYVSGYQDKIDSLLGDIMNGTYSDFLAGDQYAALSGQHQRLGQRAMQSTLGDVAARTGGLASSYAVTAGQQAYGNQMTALEQAAMEMYAGERADRYNQMNVLRGLEGDDYSKHLTELGQFNADRNFGYGVTQDERAWDYQGSQDEQARQETIAEMLAQQGDFSGYVALGLLSQEQADKRWKQWALSNQAMAAQLYPEQYRTLFGYAGGYYGGFNSKSGGGGGNNQTDDLAGGTKNNTYAFQQVRQLLDDGWTTTQIQQFLRDEKKAGNINQYTYDQSMSAVYVEAGRQRRK